MFNLNYVALHLKDTVFLFENSNPLQKRLKFAKTISPGAIK